MTTVKKYRDKEWEKSIFVFCNACYKIFFRPDEVLVLGDADPTATCDICGSENYVEAPPLPPTNKETDKK